MIEGQTQAGILPKDGLADTAGAICGQLAGAFWGESGISESLRLGLAHGLRLPFRRLGVFPGRDKIIAILATVATSVHLQWFAASLPKALRRLVHV